jgi:hypothetical protein
VNPGRRGGKPATNRLSYSAVQQNVQQSLAGRDFPNRGFQVSTIFSLYPALLYPVFDFMYPCFNFCVRTETISDVGTNKSTFVGSKAVMAYGASFMFCGLEMHSESIELRPPQLILQLYPGVKDICLFLDLMVHRFKTSDFRHLRIREARYNTSVAVICITLLTESVPGWLTD